MRIIQQWSDIFHNSKFNIGYLWGCYSVVGPRSNVAKARFGEDVPVALTVSME